jgi:predicted transcriptional regulator
MRVSVDIPKAQVEALDRLAERQQVSRAAMIRKAVEDILDSQNVDLVKAGFGLWGRGEDGLSMQRRLRSEWER